MDISDQWEYQHGINQLPTPELILNGKWNNCNIPHDWSVSQNYGVDNQPENSWLPIDDVCYMKTFEIPNTWQGENLILQVDGAYMNSTVFVNGKKVGGTPYGFLTFWCNISDAVKPGENQLVILINNKEAPTSRFYHGSSIHGKVSIHQLPSSHFELNGGIFAYVKELNHNNAILEIVSEIAHDKEMEKGLIINHQIFDHQNHLITEQQQPLVKQSKDDIQSQLTIKNARLWSPTDPYLYTLVSQIRNAQGKVIDEKRTPIGVRTACFSAQEGFVLNGQPLKLKGVCEHQELLPTGLALTEAQWRWRLGLLKQMGCNAIRTAHNPFPPIFYDVCDELGIMVMNELFDGWFRKGANDYGARFFKEHWKKDLESFVRRDRNHPSVIIWSIGNETGESDKNRITDEFHRHDPTRPTTGGTVFHGVDVSGFNGPAETPGVLEAFHRKHPNQPIVLTEVPHTIQTRGFYRTQNWFRDKGKGAQNFPSYGNKQIFFDGCNLYSSSYDNAVVRLCARDSWVKTQKHPWISGEFRWTGFDCFGEAQFMGKVFPKRIYNAGVIDLAGFPKDLYYFYQSQWTDQPMVHLLPHWTHPLLAADTIVPVVAYSNCDEVELFLNGVSLGRKSPSERLDFVWQVPYRPGKLTATGYNKRNLVTQFNCATASQPEILSLTWNKEIWGEPQKSLITLDLSTLDKERQFVPWSMNPVSYRIHTESRFLGAENGSPVDGQRHSDNSRKLFYGLARLFFERHDASEKIQVTGLAVMGDQIFQEKSLVSIAHHTTTHPLTTESPAFDDAVYYTLDGSDPSKASKKYEKPFSIEKSCVVKASLYRNGKLFLRTETSFEKGPEPHITDERWEQTVSFDNKSKSDKLHGLWTDKFGELTFLPNGEIQKDNKTIANWWFEESIDQFEQIEKLIGVGEIRWKNTKEVLPIKIKLDQPAVLEIMQKDKTRYLNKSK